MTIRAGAACLAMLARPVIAQARPRRIGILNIAPRAACVEAGLQKLLARLALQHGLPGASGRNEFPEAGGLFSYGVNATANWRLGAKFVHRIFQGAKPAEMPFEQPTTFEMVVNLATAKTLGLKIPQSVLVQASRVIE